MPTLVIPGVAAAERLAELTSGAIHESNNGVFQ